MENYNVCAICLGDIDHSDSEEPIVETVCNHLFHEECLDEWMERSACCPYCRHILNDEFEVFTYGIHLNTISRLLNKRINLRKTKWCVTLTDNKLHLQKINKNINNYQPLKTIEIDLKKVKHFKSGHDFLILHILKPNGKFYNKTIYFSKPAEAGLFFDHIMNNIRAIVNG